MATVELSMEVSAYLDEGGIGVAVYMGDDEEGNSVVISFDDLFDDALREPVVDVFVVKLRYRFGN